MEDSDGLEEVTGVRDPELGVSDHKLNRVDSSTGSDEKGRQQAIENAPRA